MRAGEDVIFDMTREVIAELDQLASVAEETSSWLYQHDRDLTGFIGRDREPVADRCRRRRPHP